MGLFTSKIFVGVMAGTVTLGGLGLLFNGSETLEKASNFVRESTSNIVKYEDNENALVAKIGTIKENAKASNQQKQEKIAQLETQKAELEATVEGLNSNITRLNGEIDALKVTLDSEKANHQATKDQLSAKVAELDTTKAELAKAKKEVANLTGLLQEALKKSKEGDKLVSELEGELQKANAEVEAHGDVVDENKEVVKDKAPMTQEEIDAIGTDVE